MRVRSAAIFGSDRKLRRTIMIDDAIRQRELIAALHLENLFIAQQLRFAGESLASDLQPTRDESERAVANICAWRSFLPAPCVAKMIDDGWQWST
jgi:hypothetical protein